MFKKYSQKGFTLIESLVATAIFVVVIAVGTGVFLTISRAQQKAVSVSETQQDARFALEAMVKEVRMGTIDYQYYTDNDIILSKGITQLAIQGSDKNYLVFRKGDGNQLEVAINPSYQKSPGNFQAMTRTDVIVEKLTFFINPIYNPYQSGVEKRQPRVTILLQAKVEDKKDPAKTSVIDLETTVTSRVYK